MLCSVGKVVRFKFGPQEGRGTREDERNIRPCTGGACSDGSPAARQLAPAHVVVARGRSDLYFSTRAYRSGAEKNH